MRKVSLVFLLAFILILPAIARADLNNGLVAYYSFNNCDATDDSGNGHDGTIYGSPECVDGKIGKAFEFDGENDKIVTNKFKDTWNKWTISFFIKTHSNEKMEILERERIGWYYDLEVALSYGKICIENDNGDSNGCSNKIISDNIWHHIVVLYDGNIKKVFIDSIIDTSFNDRKAFINVEEPIYIGAHKNPSKPKYLNGIIDEVRIYNRALSESEIKELYEQGLNTCSGGGYTEDDLQKKYQEGIEEGKKICQQNPSACGITVSSSTGSSSDYQTGYNNGYNKGYEDGKSSCSETGGGENPFLPPTTSSQCATFDFFTNKFHVPCFQGSGATYWLDFKLINQDPVQLELTKFGKNK